MSQLNEAQLFRDELGEDWPTLAANIRQRFEHDPLPGQPVYHHGVMSRIECSRAGKVLGCLLQSIGALMPHQGMDIPVNISVHTAPGRPAVFKQREYLFPQRKPVLFNSRMLRDAKGRLIEYVGGGFGMYISAYVLDGDLHFNDKGYFWEIFGLRIPMPRLLSPGNVHLHHQDISATEFAITITITHPLFGPMYFQHGRFKHGSDLQAHKSR